MNMDKLLLFDVDGTLVDSGKEIDSYMVSVLKELKKNGYHIGIAGGGSIDKILNQMEKNLNNPARLLEADWSQYLPEPLLSGSRPKFVKPDGTLIIEADNATLMYAMRNYYTRELLMKFRQRFPNEINNILVVTADYKGKK